jgi:SagB-type dehydrogenase family enzyme
MKGRRMIFVIGAVLLTSLVVSITSSGRGDESDDDLSIGERFHRETGLTWLGALGDVFTPKPEEPPPYKTYPDRKQVSLPEPGYSGTTVEEAIQGRRSVRNYSDRMLSLQELSQLVYAAQGVTGEVYDQALRTAPSAGALYPYEVYVIAHRVEDLPAGIYHYAVPEHALSLIEAGDFRDKITSAGLSQDMLGEAGVVFVLSAIFDRVRHKYDERGFRYVYIEAGHISQNIYLQSVSLGLGSVAVGAFLDRELNDLIGVDGLYEAAIYLHAVGTL